MLETATTTRQTVQGPGLVRMQPLLVSAVKGLGPMFDAEKQVFCYRLNRGERGMVREGVSHRYTLMTLMGLHRAEAAGLQSPVDVRAALDGMGRNTEWLEYGGDLGLYLWTCAVIAPESLPQVLLRFDWEAALESYPDTRERRTMELAWFLTGLSYLKLSQAGSLKNLEGLARRTFELIKSNQGAKGACGHLSTSGSTVGAFRGRIGTFADQVYPIYALARYGQVFGVNEALDRSMQCAEVICKAQGPLGQWWWHYDSVSGRVTGKHPVYSVHQEAMGPMALYALSEATGRDFSREIFTGLDWIAGRNELQLDMRDEASSVVWRCLYHGKLKSYANELMNFAGLPSSESGLKVRYECRPYELGWLLYAFAHLSQGAGSRS